MKKIILSIAVILITVNADAQIWKKASKALDKKEQPKKEEKAYDPDKIPNQRYQEAKVVLRDEPCDRQALSWVNDKLKREPEHKEAERLIKACDEQKKQKAYKDLEANFEDTRARSELIKLSKHYPEDEKLNYYIAKSFFQKGGSHIVDRYISKAIDKNPKNLEYRWMRVKSNLLRNSSLDDFERAITDLNYMISQGAESAKVYTALSIAQNEVAKDWMYKKVEKNKGWSDDNSKELKEKADNEAVALKYFNKALESANKAIEIDEEAVNNLQISSIKNYIKDLKK